MTLWIRTGRRFVTVLCAVLAATGVARAQGVVQSQGPDFGTFSIGQLETSLSATGGDGSYTWSIAAGALPPGLALRTDLPSFFSPGASAGLIGVATTPGLYSFTLRASSGGVDADQPSTLRVTALLNKENQLPDAFVGAPYVYALSALGNAAGVTWAPSGSLPAGLSLSGGGVVSGTPTTAGFANISFSLTDGVDTVFKNVSLTISAVRITSPGVLPNVTQNVAYSTTIAAAGGAGGYTFSANGLPNGLSLNAASGVIAGTVTAGGGGSSSLGKVSVNVTARDSASVAYSKTMSIDVLGAAPALPAIAPSNAAIYDCTLGVACTRTISVQNGGAAPFTWTATGLPPGMSIRSGSGTTLAWVTPGDAELWGTATATGAYSVQLKVTDALGATAANTFPMTVSPLLQTDFLANGTIDTAYSQIMRVIGGTGASTVVHTAGQLAAGLTVNGATLVLSGNPTESGNFNPVFTYTDAASHTLQVDRFFFINGAGSGISINSNSDLGSATTGSSYSRTLNACCAGSITWSVTGSLPPGLTFSTGGLLSGTPSVPGPYTFLLKATDAANASNYAARQFTLNATPLNITNSTLPFGNVGTLYTQTLTATGGTGAVTWTVPAGSYLPPGLTLASNGVVGGTPTESGQYRFTATATDAASHVRSNSFNVSIYPVGGSPPNTAPTITNITDRVASPGTASSAIPFTIGDDADTAGLVVSGSSANQALVPNANIVFSGSGANRFVTVTPTNTGGTATITVTVTDAAAASASDTFALRVWPSLTISDTSVPEGNSGTSTATLSVVLSAPSSQTITVQYQTAQRTAIAGVDFTAASGTLTFAPGTTLQTIPVTVAGDTVPEIDETFAATLSGSVDATIAGGFATATIVDNDGTADRRAALVQWIQPVGVDATEPGWLSKTAATGWNAGAASGQALLGGDGAMEFSAGETGTIRMAGLSRGNANTDFSDIDFAIYLHMNTTFYVFEGGISRGVFGTYAGDDRFSVAVASGAVVYGKNGVPFYTSSLAPTYPLLVDTSLHTPAGSLAGVVLGGRLARDVMWTNLVGVNPFPGALAKLSTTGWNAGAASTRALVSGDGFMAFTATETNTTRMLGLSRDNSNTDSSDIDFGLFLHSNATVYVVEGGVTRGVFGSYATGDRFQVAIESGQVVYRRNGVTLYTSLVAPSYPLLVDSALYTTAATVVNVTVAGTFATDVTFANAVNVDVCACYDTLAKTVSAASGWNAGAISTQEIVKGDAFVEFTTNDDPTHKMAGLSHGNTGTDSSDIDFAILLGSNHTFYVFEGGTFRGAFGVHRTGDRLRVGIEGGVVKYRLNGVLFYTSGSAPSYPLLVDTALFTPGAALQDMVVWSDLGETVAWTATAGVSATDGMLTKTSAAAWNAGAISTGAIPSGDGFVSFTTNEATTHKMIGLSRGNTNTDHSDIDFAILLASNGTYYVFENGTSRGVFGSYLAGDRFDVAVKAGVVRYLRNGAAFYASLVAPAYPLLVDTALYSSGSTIVNVVMGCVSAVCQ